MTAAIRLGGCAAAITGRRDWACRTIQVLRLSNGSPTVGQNAGNDDMAIWVRAKLSSDILNGWVVFNFIFSLLGSNKSLQSSQ